MKEQFSEVLLSEARDLVDSACQEFDWQLLYRCLGEDATNGEHERLLAETVVRLLELLLANTDSPMRPHSVGLRVIALAWVLNPAYFEGSPSLRELADRCGVAPAALAQFTAQASRFIRWRNRAQRHAWNWAERSTLG